MTVTVDAVPLGEVEVRRGEHAHATDLAIGQVQGLVVDPAGEHVTQVLHEGHLWGRKQIAIQIGAVTEVDADEGIKLSISKQDVQNPPCVSIADL